MLFSFNLFLLPAAEFYPGPGSPETGKGTAAILLTPNDT
jgi:hypothetical protein